MTDLLHSSSKERIKRLIVGPLCCNCYIIETADSALIIDPGDEADLIIEECEKDNVYAKFIINTHAHFDHIGANWKIKDYFQAPILMHEAEKVLLPKGAKVDRFIKEHERINIGDIELSFIHTPGHTPGSICIKMGHFLFSGDTLFECGIGRTDLPFGSWMHLLSSLRLLKELPDETIVYPGHGESTTIQKERRQNPYFKGC